MRYAPPLIAALCLLGGCPTEPPPEELCNGLDDDGDGEVGLDEVDDDGDGFAECEGDCDDADWGTSPGRSESCDGVDNDCDGRVAELKFGVDADLDDDGLLDCFNAEAVVGRGLALLLHPGAAAWNRALHGAVLAAADGDCPQAVAQEVDPPFEDWSLLVTTETAWAGGCSSAAGGFVGSASAVTAAAVTNNRCATQDHLFDRRAAAGWSSPAGGWDGTSEVVRERCGVSGPGLTRMAADGTYERDLTAVSSPGVPSAPGLTPGRTVVTVSRAFETLRSGGVDAPSRYSGTGSLTIDRAQQDGPDGSWAVSGDLAWAFEEVWFDGDRTLTGCDLEPEGTLAFEGRATPEGPVAFTATVSFGGASACDGCAEATSGGRQWTVCPAGAGIEFDGYWEDQASGP